MNGQSNRLSAIVRRGLLLLIVCWCGMVHAQVPHLLNYQGFLTNPGGTPISSAVVVTFRLYNVASGGSALYTETQLSVNVSNGIFNAVIGSVTPLTLPFDAPYWLTVAINADGEMSPRQQVTATPYSLRSANADALAAAATVTGPQITGSLSTATLPAGNLTGTIGTAQVANAAITLAKLNSNGCSDGQVLKYNGTAWTCGNDVTSVTVVGLSGTAGSVTPNSSDYVFVGPTQIIGLASPNARLTGAGVVALGLTTGGLQVVNIDLCYQLGGVGTVSAFSGDNAIIRPVTTTRANYSVSSTVALAVGNIYAVGLCVLNSGIHAISNNDFVNGWVMATP